MLKPLAILIAIPLLLGSCNSLKFGKVKEYSKISVPGSWSVLSKSYSGKVENKWLNSLNDKKLIKITNEALNNNYDLKASALLLESAKEGTIIGKSARLPFINLSGSGSRSRSNEEYNSNYGLTLAASWEVDLWGRLKNLDLASRENLLQAEADYKAAKLSLVANTAKSWFNLITAQQLLDLAVKTKESYVANARIIERNYKAGDQTASPLAVQFARNNVASAERNLINQKLSREEAARSLELLLGKYPSGQFGSGNELPTMKKNVPSGLPSELLLRRPDLISAAAAVRASSQRAEASMKDLLPSFSLTGRGSNSSRKLDQFILDPETIVWSAATSLAQTLFRAGAQRASARIALQQNERSIRRFSSEILRALREVESALATEKSLAEQNKYLSTELRQAELAEKQAMRDYSEGLIRIISVLEAQRRAVASRRAMIFLKNQRIQNRIDLHLALGGSFN
ncbi:MAG: hypothetical protein CMO46_05970 [Verrucomicrobiales bacterium]|nr:hypothetical protein [Verrucomicrobiales bacterium]